MKKAMILCAMLLAMSGLALPNPAYMFCVSHGGQIETRADKRGNQYGICMFNQDGMQSECDQWEFVRGQCAPGQCLYWSVETRMCEMMP